MSLASKLLSIQRKIGAVTKSSSNPHFKSKYADLNEVLDVAKEALNSEGIVISQAPGADQYGKYLETSLIDAEASGSEPQVLSGKVYFSGNEDNMQKMGAAITYARRFGLVTMLALGSEDDDGESAVGRGRNTSPAALAPKATPTGALSKSSTIDKIGQYARVAIERRITTQDDFARMLVDKYQVESTKALTESQATELLTSLTTLVNGKKT